jgi:hypothetical protein
MPLSNTPFRSSVFQFMRSACGAILRARTVQTFDPLSTTIPSVLEWDMLLACH